MGVSGEKRLSFLLSIFLGAATTLAAGCNDDDGENGPAPARGTGGANGSVDGGRDASDGGAADGNDGGVSRDAGDAGDGGPGDAGMIAVNRPERRDFSPALLAQLRLPPGFRIDAVATGVMNARMLAVAPDGLAYVTTPMTSEIWRLRDDNGDGDFADAGERTVVGSADDTPALNGVHGITFYQGNVYLASVKSVVRATYSATGRFTSFTPLVTDLPDGGQHPNRTLAVGPDGLLYVSVGSDCNACAESNSEHATMLRLNLDGTAASNPANPQHPALAHNPMTMISPRVWASGLRNTLGFAFHPVSNELWGMDQGSDGLGADVPQEELNHLVGGKSFGWPYCYNMRTPDPVVDQPSQMLSKAAYCPGTEPNVAGIPAHSSPIAFLFYTGAQFPAAYRNDAFQVLRGSWDRPDPMGYKVVRLHFDATGTPAPLPGTTSVSEDFLSGFLIEGGRAHFGRIAGLAVDSAGALLLSDDSNGVIYRISYTGGATADAGASD